MNKILLENKLGQVLPILVRDRGNPKKLVQSHINGRGRKLITPAEMSQHISSLATKGHLKVTYMEGVVAPVRTAGAQKAAPPLKATPKVKSSKSSSVKKKKTTKKGRK